MMPDKQRPQLTEAQYKEWQRRVKEELALVREIVKERRAAKAKLLEQYLKDLEEKSKR